MSIRESINAFSFAHFGDVWADLRERITLSRVRRNAYAETYRELMSLTDRELNDLGFARFDIRRIAKEAADDAVRRHVRGA